MKEKKLSILFILLLLGMFMTGCSANTTAVETDTQKETLEFVTDCGNCVTEYRDTETGVHYFIFSQDIYKGGMGGMCPRYNADGTLYVD